MPRTEAIKFKGTRQGVHLVIDPDPELPEILLELDQRLKGTDQFFRSADVMLNLGDRSIDEAEFTILREILARYGLTIVSVEAGHTDSQHVFRNLNLQVVTPESPVETIEDMEPTTSNGDGTSHLPRGAVLSREALVIHKTLRSGQAVNHPSDICLIGDVNPGAEVIAGDNVIIWGSLRGVVQAGVGGNEEAVVCALELAPTQLRIASLVTRQPEAMDAPFVPEMARIIDGQIVVEQWQPRSRRSRRRLR